MPLRKYLLMHPDARLSAAERDALASGLDATIGVRGPARKVTEQELGELAPSFFLVGLRAGA